MKLTVCIVLAMAFAAINARGYGSQSSRMMSGYGNDGGSSRSGGYESDSSSEESYGSQSRSNGGYGSQTRQSNNGGYGSQSRQSNNGGYGSQSRQSNNGGYGSQSRQSNNGGYGEQNGNVNYKLKYNIDLPEDNHGSSANWMVEQDPQIAMYTLDQTHPYGARSNVYFMMENDH